MKDSTLQEKSDPVPYIGIRHLQCVLCFFCLALCYAMRVNLSVAIVAMSDSTATSTDHMVFDWDEKKKSYLLSSFFWGYIITQVPSGQIAERYGSKTILLLGVLSCSVLTLLTPAAAKYGDWPLLFVVRVIMGLLQACAHPATHAMLARWAPVEERGILGTVCYSGSQFGAVVMLAISGFIAESSIGWPGIFYVSGVAGFIWAIFWFFLSASSPAQHRLCSVRERSFIESSLGKVETDARITKHTPWAAFFKSPAFISLLIVHCTHMWGFWTLLTQLPSYIKNIMGIDMKNSALLSALPYAIMCILSFCFIGMAKVLDQVENVSLDFSRKIFNTIGHWTPALTLLFLGYVTSQHAVLAIVLLTITIGITAATYLGFQVNHIDLSPNHAGTLMGITNGAANVMSALAPLAVGQVVTDVKDPVQWRIVFFVAAALYFFGNLLFIILGKVDVQVWNDIHYGEKKEAVEETPKLLAPIKQSFEKP